MNPGMAMLNRTKVCHNKFSTTQEFKNQMKRAHFLSVEDSHRGSHLFKNEKSRVPPGFWIPAKFSIPESILPPFNPESCCLIGMQLATSLGMEVGKEFSEYLNICSGSWFPCMSCSDSVFSLEPWTISKTFDVGIIFFKIVTESLQASQIHLSLGS